MDQFKEAMFYERLNADKVRCLLCPHECIIAPGDKGICRVRNNIEGTLYSKNYGKIFALAMDPVEKKPLYHFYPGKYLLSIGTVGCNFRCSFCQNYHIAQRGVEAEAEEGKPYEIGQSQLLSLCRQEEDCIGIAYTYNEPGVWYEYVRDTAVFIKSEGYKNVLVTNGYIGDKALVELLPYIDAMNIDVKGFTEEYYKKICGGSLEYVKNTVKTAASKCHIEITTLIIPGFNDSEQEVDKLSKWIASISPLIPLHLSRYYPRYKMEEEPTKVETLKRLKKIAENSLKYVYIGNLNGVDINTYCSKCGALLIKRSEGVFIEHLKDGICLKCGEPSSIKGI